jgi:hypothetical protein
MRNIGRFRIIACATAIVLAAIGVVLTAQAVSEFASAQDNPQNPPDPKPADSKGLLNPMLGF